MFYGGKASFEDLYRELLTTKESKAEIERNREELVSRNRELELKYQDLLLELKQLNVSDGNTIAELQCQLKLKNYELERCSVLLAETDAKYKHLTLENEKLSKKLEFLKDELAQCQTSSEKQICALKLQLRDKSTKLKEYETLEAEIDKIIMRAAQLPDELDAERILSSYDKEALMSLNSKHRMRQSLNLARRVLELENDSVELKTELFKERDTKQALQQELIATKSCLSQVTHPTSELIDVVLKKDLENMKLKSRIEQLEHRITKLHESETSLRKELTHVSAHDQDMEVIKNMISDLRFSEEKSPHASKDTEVETHLKSPPPRPAPSSSAGFLVSAPSMIHIKKPLSFTKLSQANLTHSVSQYMT